MSLLPLDQRHLTAALGLARAAVGLASPNPTVGCVIANGESFLGEGAHHYDARDHAEMAALKQASSLGHDVRGATAYVTLEPCSHHGRTGPCADALIAAGIARCVIATVDPNPLVRGSGVARLRAAGIAVDSLDPTSSLAVEARTLNDAFAHFIQHKRPFVTLKAALSVDGKLAPPPSTRSETAPHWITGTVARNDAQTLRREADAILTGIGTVLADNPSLTDRTGLPRRRPLLRIVLDTELRVPLDSTLVSQPTSVISTGAQRSGETPVFRTGNDVLIVCSLQASTEREAQLIALGAQILRVPTSEGQLDLNALLAALATRGILGLLVEAGATVNGSLLRADLVDKLVLYYAERELGLDAVPFATNYESPYVTQQRLTRTTRETFPNGDTEDIRITGYLHDPWANIA
jgi:diaminohydroxyphosphoribosylaminopyrimidine deaminase/5-amino-6-(5-phosphoribosylamino)uracil reductase